MNYEEIELEIKKVINEVLKLDIAPDDIAGNDSFFTETLGLDSLNLINFVVALEEKYDIIIDDDDLRVELFENINTITQYIVNKIEEKANIDR
jgi:acyl carrier protein